MKKLLSIILFAFVLFSGYAGGFFSDRYFEIKTCVPVGLSNNTASFNDLFKKEVVIDLRDISNRVPDEGFNITATANPTYGFNLRVANLFLGFNTGIDLYDRFVISKGLFDLLGKGSEPEKEVDVSIQNNLDAFISFNFDLGLKIKTNSLHIRPSMFIPVVSAFGDMGKFTFLNDEDGNVNISYKTDMGIYSLVDFNDPSKDLNPDIFKHVGFDLGGNYRHPFGEKFALEIDGRIPIVPGNLQYLTKIETSFNTGFSFLGADDEDETGDETILEDDTSNNIDDSGSQTYTLDKQNFYVNRPMKFDFYLECYPVGPLLTIRGGLGIGVYHPFVSGYEVYGETYLGAMLNFGILKVGLSTEYTDRVFKNQLSLSANLRIIQVDTGVSLQASSFTKSFTGSGYGAFVNVSVGF